MKTLSTASADIVTLRAGKSTYSITDTGETLVIERRRRGLKTLVVRYTDMGYMPVFNRSESEYWAETIGEFLLAADIHLASKIKVAA